MKSFSKSSRPIRVYVLDLLSIVPYYAGHLCAGLQSSNSAEVVLGSIRYGHDRTFFERIGVRIDPWLLDVADQIPKRLATMRRLLKGAEYFLNLLLLCIRFALRAPDVVHVQFLPLVSRSWSPELWFLRFVRGLNITIVYTVHNVLPHEARAGDRKAYATLYGLVDRLVCHNLHTKNRLSAEFGIRPEAVTIIPHGPLFQEKESSSPVEARIALGLPEDRCVVLFQGIIRPYKGLQVFLEAWQQALKAGAKGTLVIAGTGDPTLLSEIGKDVAERGLSASVRLIFRFVSVEEVNRLYDAADILAYPYSAVTTSGALLTGIGHRKAILATALPAFTEMLHDEQNALLVPYGEVNDFAASLTRLMNDRALRERLVENLRTEMEDLPSWKEIAGKTITCYLAAMVMSEQHGAVRVLPNQSVQGKSE